MADGIAEVYFDELNKTTNPISVLAKLFGYVFGTKDINYGMIGKLCNLYGKDILFFSILDCSDVDNLDLNSAFGLISYFAKKRLEKKYISNSSIDMSKLSEKNGELLNKKRRIKIQDPFKETE